MFSKETLLSHKHNSEGRKFCRPSINTGMMIRESDGTAENEDNNNTQTSTATTSTTATTTTETSTMEATIATETQTGSATVTEENVSITATEPNIVNDNNKTNNNNNTNNNNTIEYSDHNSGQDSDLCNRNIHRLVKRLLEARKRPPNRAIVMTKDEIIRVCEKVLEVFRSQPMLVETKVGLGVKLVGDIHGQFADLLRLFEHCGWPSSRQRYVFLGDYVDRGKQGLETIVLLFCYKILFPSHFFLLRGNHECAGVTKIYGFYDEVKRRFDTQLWRVFVDVFNYMPIAALIEDSIFGMHGGLSPELENFDQIRNIERPCDIPDFGLMCDILWSDPNYDIKGGWAESSRGLSFTFGSDVIKDFSKKMQLDLIIRAHQVVEKGYLFFANRRLLTIFSAPNYCGEYENDAGVIAINQDLVCHFYILRPTASIQINYMDD